MAKRLYPRVPVSIPSSISWKGMSIDAELSDISVGGVFLKPRAPVNIKKGSTIIVKYNIPGFENFEYAGDIVRIVDEGFAAVAVNLDSETRKKLWIYLADRLKGFKACPYCGDKHEVLPVKCQSCGWNLTFDSPAYPAYHERMHLLKRIQTAAEGLSPDDLSRVAEFIEGQLGKRESPAKFNELMGTSTAMTDVFASIERLSKLDISVVICGEIGTGKKLTASTIHEMSRLPERPFVHVNCASMPEETVEAELFRSANDILAGGTLFIEEITVLSQPLQAKLIGMCGGNRLGFRIMVSTSLGFEEAKRVSPFITGLIAKCGAVPLELPPLRDRGEDKLALAKYLLAKVGRELRSPASEFSVDAVTAIDAYRWPGNVMEMMDRIKKACLSAVAPIVSAADLGIEYVPSASNGNVLKEVVSVKKREVILKALVEHNFVILRAAKTLGISRQRLHTLINEYDIDVSDLKKRSFVKGMPRRKRAVMEA